jgi:tRNA A37 threonylcarbamoyladenosine modification protein TsaB|tara:strand:- start:1389 stop:1772 length:384 start_codon:yes stop_codon:yes gene_type:complete
MIKNFLIISCTNKNDSIGLKINNNFFIKKIQTNIQNYDKFVNFILAFLKEHNTEINKNFSIIVNLGPGSFSSIRVSLAVAKGMQISKKMDLYGYKDHDLTKFDLNNIELLIKTKLLENKLIKPVYLS